VPRYWPYGGERSLSGDALLTDRWFTGQRDESFDGLGLYHYGARAMSTVSRRFVSPDGIVPDPMNPQSLNRYSYVLNNPLRYTDPTGHCGVAADARLNNLLRLCGEGTYFSYGHHLVSRLPHLSSAIIVGVTFTSAEGYYCAVGPCGAGGWIEGLARSLTDFGSEPFQSLEKPVTLGPQRLREPARGRAPQGGPDSGSSYRS
jgi:RHS repeat-associated protein